MYRVKIEVPIRAAHRLLNYEGKCKFLHGEAYTVIAEFARETPDEKGMVIDFGVAKRKIKEFLDRFCDHSVLLSYADFEAINYLIKLKNTNITLFGPGSSLIRIFTDHSFQKKYEVLNAGLVNTFVPSGNLDLLIKVGYIEEPLWRKEILGREDFISLFDKTNYELLEILNYNFPGLLKAETLDIQNSNPTAENMSRVFYSIFFSVLELDGLNRVGVVESYRDSVGYYDEL